MVLLIAGIIVAAMVLGVFALRRWASNELAQRVMESSILLADQRQLDRKREKAEIFFLGACEFRSGLDTRLFGGEAVSLSVPSVGYIEQYYFLKHYLDKMPGLKVLVLSVGDNSFCSRTSTGLTSPVLFHKYLDYDQIIEVSPPDVKARLLAQRWIYSRSLGNIHYGHKFVLGDVKRYARIFFRKFTLSNMRRFVKSRFLNKESSDRQKEKVRTAVRGRSVSPGRDEAVKVSSGKEGREVRGSKTLSCTDIDKAKKGVEVHFSRPVFDNRALKYFGKILDMCGERDIKVVTVCYPRSRLFLEYSREYVSEQEFLSRIVNAPEFKEGIYRHINYLGALIGRDDLFLPSGAELNKKGKEEFSPRVYNDLAGIFREIGVNLES